MTWRDPGSHTHYSVTRLVVTNKSARASSYERLEERRPAGVTPEGPQSEGQDRGITRSLTSYSSSCW